MHILLHCFWLIAEGGKLLLILLAISLGLWLCGVRAPVPDLPWDQRPVTENIPGTDINQVRYDAQRERLRFMVEQAEAKKAKK